LDPLRSRYPVYITDIAAILAPAGGTRPPGIDSAVVLNDRQIRVFSVQHHDSVLRRLADPAYALVDGPAVEGLVAGRSIDMTPQESRRMIQAQLSPLGDARDALDRGADLIVTRDPALVEYAAQRPEFATFALPWSRTYLLVQPASAEPLPPVMTDLERRSLARDAVRADARSAEPPFWWHGIQSCPAGGKAGAKPASDRIAYQRGDEIARSLAERLVALVGSEIRLSTVSLDQVGFAAALRAGTERAYVVAVPRQTLAPCREAADLPGNPQIQPLIDSRAHAIIRRGAPPLSIEWDGTIRVVEP
jgi:hypothetical protein